MDKSGASGGNTPDAPSLILKLKPRKIISSTKPVLSVVEGNTKSFENIQRDVLCDMPPKGSRPTVKRECNGFSRCYQRTAIGTTTAKAVVLLFLMP